MCNKDDELRRGFGLSTATFVVIASMVGTGILVSPGYMMAALGNYPVIIALWVIGGGLAFCGALCVAELSAAMPQAGGEYVYLREAYGSMPAFVSGWTSFVLGFSAPLAVAGYVAAVYLLTPFGAMPTDGDPGHIVQLTAAAIILLATVPNMLGHRQSAWAQNLTTILKLALFLALVVAGFLSGNGSFEHVAEGRPIGEIPLGTVASQLFYVMFAYSGWNAAAYVAGEIRKPGTVLPRSLLLGTGLVTVLYLALTIVFAYAVPLKDIQLANAEQVPQIAAANLFGARISGAVTVALGLTFLATINAFIITGPRIYYAMARDGLFPAVAGRLSSKGQVPVYAMVAQSLCAIVILVATDFESMYKYASVGLALFAMFYIGAVYVLRWRRPDLPRPFRVPGYPFVPAIFIAVTAFTAVFAFLQWPGPSLVSLCSILGGIPVYYVWSALRAREKDAG